MPDERTLNLLQVIGLVRLTKNDVQLQIDSQWTLTEIDNYLRSLYPVLFEYLDLRYGAHQGLEGCSDLHWALLKRTRNSLLVVQPTEGYNGSIVTRYIHPARARNSDLSTLYFGKQQPLRWIRSADPSIVATKNPIPSKIYLDLSAALQHVRDGDIEEYENDSQDDVEENESEAVPKNKGKGKAVAAYSSDAESSSFEPLPPPPPPSIPPPPPTTTTSSGFLQVPSPSPSPPPPSTQPRRMSARLVGKKRVRSPSPASSPGGSGSSHNVKETRKTKRLRGLPAPQGTVQSV